MVDFLLTSDIEAYIIRHTERKVAVMGIKERNSKILSFSTAKSYNYNASTDREINYIGQRIAEARNAAGLNLGSFCDLLAEHGVSVGKAAVSKWEVGRSVPSAYQLLAISKALQIQEGLSFFMSTGVRPELNDVGMKKLAEYKADLIASGRYKPQTKAMDLIQYEEWPVSNLAVSAGTGEFLDEGNFEMISFPAGSVPEGADFGIRISGTSMEPVYHDGQIIWVQKCEAVNVGQVGIFICDGEGYIKVYGEQEPEPEHRDEFIDSNGVLHMQPVLISYNQDYLPKVVSRFSELQVVGRVL